MVLSTPRSVSHNTGPSRYLSDCQVSLHLAVPPAPQSPQRIRNTAPDTGRSLRPRMQHTSQVPAPQSGQLYRQRVTRDPQFTHFQNWH